MQIDQGERKCDCTVLFLWWACVSMSLRADQASLIFWRVSQASCTCLCRALTKHFPPVLANMRCVMSNHADAHMTALLAINEIYMITPGTGKFEVSGAFVCMFLAFLSHFLPFHCCLEVRHVQVAAFALTPLICRGQMQELLLSWAVCRLNCLRPQQFIFLSNKCVAGTGTYFRIVCLHCCDTKHPASFERRQRLFLWLFL